MTPRSRDDGRVLPQDLDAERSLLGAMLLTADAIAAASSTGIDAADFLGNGHSAIFAAVAKLHAAEEPVDPVTVADALRSSGELDQVGGAGALASLLTGCPATSSAARYARIVVEHARRRRVIGVAGQLADLGYDLGRDVDGVEEKARQLLAEATGREPSAKGARSIVDGATFVLDAPARVPVIWGRGAEVAWAAGEPFLLVGPQGVGKTTLGQQLTLARIGLRRSVLGMPVAPGEQRVLYIAADRPAQAQRSFARMVSEDDRALLAERLVVWRGPLPEDLAIRPEGLVQAAMAVDAGTVVLDSVKDLAIGLVKDEVGAGVNRAFQLALAEGIEVAGLHHQRKAVRDGGPPRTLDDVYGSGWITAGCGSVVLLWGQPGDPIVDLAHLKQPAEPVGPMKLLHDHDTGTTTLYDANDPLAHLRAAPGGLTAQALAVALFGTRSPKANDVEKARRRLDGLAKQGLAHKVEGHRGGAEGGEPARYFPATRRPEPPTGPHETDHAAITAEGKSAGRAITHPDHTLTDHEAITPITSERETAGESDHGSDHADHAATDHAPSPLFRGGERDGLELSEDEAGWSVRAGITADERQRRRSHPAYCPECGGPLDHLDGVLVCSEGGTTACRGRARELLSREEHPTHGR